MLSLNNSSVRAFTVGLLCALFMCHIAYAEISDEKLAELDERTYTLSAKFYQHYQYQGSRFTSTIIELERAVKKHIDKSNNIDAIYLIKSNLALIQDNIDHPSSYFFLNLLLEHNELQTAAELYDAIQLMGNTIIVANGRYVMARYALKRNQWQQTLDYISGISGNLPEEESKHATLIEGFVLQKLKQHREAIEVYENSQQQAHNSPLTQNNLAVAYIRQDWWTDGHQVFKQLLKSESGLNNEELANRTHIILGYSLMRKEYYRDAREAFRKVTLDSHYVNRALLGLALTAINQHDYVGALNAVNILKEKKSYELTAEEAYLIQPYIYSKLQQHLTASAGFNEAIAHYQQRIKEIEALQQQPGGIAAQLETDFHSLLIKEYRFDLSRDYPLSLLENYHLIKQLLLQADDESLIAELQMLEQDYRILLAEICQEKLNERVSQLNSYIDQSRFGLALLFDNSLVE